VRYEVFNTSFANGAASKGSFNGRGYLREVEIALRGARKSAGYFRSEEDGR